MSWSAPANAELQPDDTMGLDRSDNRTRSLSWKGPYSALESAAGALKRGDAIVVGWSCSTYDLRRVAGNLGVLTVNCIPSAEFDDDDDDNPVQTPLKETWSVRTVRNDVSVMAYCGPSGSNPNRAQIEAWMKEPDGELAARHSYRNSDGEEVEITASASLALIEKIEKGVESVIRFYPVVTCRRLYSLPPPNCLENIGFIDTPFSPGANSGCPGNLASKLSSYQWLKVQDDVDEGQDGKWTRTESWMGIKQTDSNLNPWDADLYGSNRWKMPYQAV